jgi:protein SERAC1
MVADQVVFWPGDLLPKECPDARILTWGYDTIVTKHLTGAVNKSNVFAQGKNLLYALGRERPLDRPLIFVAHSLGGIIVKEVGTLV